MANPDHLSKLKEGVEEWNKWRKDHPDVVPDLSGVKLIGAKLSRAFLNRAKLSRAYLRGVFLNRAKLSGANLSEANLEGAQLIGAKLIGANLSGAFLKRVKLSRANLSETNLSRVDLSGAKLSEANLSRAKLIGAQLIGANLSRANLSGANLNCANLNRSYLIGANLSMADFRKANLSDADLSNTSITAAQFTDIDLSNVKGLDTVIHHGPSSIGIDTIFASKGKIQEIFLRGAGVPEIFIQYLPSLTCNPLEFYSCFISYSHANKDFARRLHDRLQGHSIRCWLDEHQLVPGDDVHDQIDRGIKLWDKVILCCSEASLTSWWVDKELDRALQKEELLWKERQEKVLAIIPVDLDGYVFSWDSGKAGMVKSRFIGDFKNWKDNDEFEKSFEKLLKALRTPESREPAPIPKL
jgi:uncharacterized protein YjbI with pentapeptide repeats